MHLASLLHVRYAITLLTSQAQKPWAHNLLGL